MTNFIVHVAEVVVDRNPLLPGEPALDADAIAMELRRLYSEPPSRSGAADVQTRNRGGVVTVLVAESPARALARAIFDQLAERSVRE